MATFPDRSISAQDELDLPAKQRFELVERVSSSGQFSRSARLRDFLLYVGRESIMRGNRELHEEQIGVAVFGRPPDYDRGQDNIVRVNATELRKRIDNYFTEDGASEPVLFTLPRGSYIPVFYLRQVQVEALPAPVNQAVPASIEAFAPPPAQQYPDATNRSLVWQVLTVVFAAACVVLLIFGKFRSPGEAKQATELNAFWSQFAKPAAQTDIVLSDEAISLSEEMIGHPISLNEYLDHTYQRKLETDPAIDPIRKQDLHTLFAHNLVTLGGFRAAQQMMAMSPSLGNVQLIHSRFYEASSLKRNNLILIGGKKANPWVWLFDQKLNFSLDYDDKNWQAVVINRHPGPGEQASYRPVMDPNAFSSYAVVSYLSNPSDTGNVLILAGADSDATAAAAEFMTSEEKLAALKKQIHARTLPHFEALLKTSRLNGTSLNSELVAYRTLE